MRVALLALILGGCPSAPAPEKPASSSKPATSTSTSSSTPSISTSSSSTSSASGILQVDVLDVGQGDAILLRAPGDKSVLIDAGTGQKGEAALPLLQELGVTKLDLVVATHPHSDHIGGLDEVLGALPAKLLIDNGLPHTTDTYDKLMKLVESKGIKYKAAKSGQTYRLDGGVKLEVLNPSGDPITGTRSDLNANSVVIRATHGANCFLFTGDAEAETEERMLQNKVQPCDVLKSAHHGSGYASSAAFLDAVRPQVVLISVGAGNEYGHPDPDAMARYKAAGAPTLRTDQGGTLHLESDGKKVVITPARGKGMTITGRGVESAAATASATTTSGGKDAGDDGRLDLNTATAAELEALPGVGEKTAAAIIAWRKKNGPFRSVDDLDAVDGIGAATLEKLRPLVRAGP